MPALTKRSEGKVAHRRKRATKRMSRTLRWRGCAAASRSAPPRGYADAGLGGRFRSECQSFGVSFETSHCLRDEPEREIPAH